jgi:hypothetical protein
MQRLPQRGKGPGAASRNRQQEALTAEYAEYAEGEPGGSLFSAYSACSAVIPWRLRLQFWRSGIRLFFSLGSRVAALLSYNPLKLNLGVMPKVDQ